MERCRPLQELKSPPLSATSYSLPLKEAMKRNPKLARFSQGEARIPLGSPEALQLYNQTILKEKYGISVELQLPFLIPTIGVRVAFLEKVLRSSDQRVAEIGIGASAVLSLLAAKQYQKEVIATEIDEAALALAREQISRNHLETRIELRQSKGEVIKGILLDHEKIDLVFTYPPLYPPTDNFGKLRKKRGFKGTRSELYDLSEKLSFLTRLVIEFLEHSSIHRLAVLLLKDEQLKHAVQTVHDYLHPPCSRVYPFEQLILETSEIHAGTRKRPVFILEKL